MTPEIIEMTFSQSNVTSPIRLESSQLSKDGLFLFFCVVVGFAIRLFLIPQDSVLNGDGIYYTTLGERFVLGDFDGGISAYWSPLYSVLTGIASLFFQDRDFAGRSISVVAGALVTIPSFMLVRLFFGHRSAYLGTVLVVFHPFLIKSSTWAMTESLYTLLFTTMVLSGWYALSTEKTRTFLLTGLLLGVAYLVKPEAIGFLALFFLTATVATLCRERIKFVRSLVRFLVLFGGFSICFLPYFLYLHQKTGQWTLSQKITVNLPVADYDGEFLALTVDRQTTMKDRIWGDDYKTSFSPNIAPPISEPKSTGLSPIIKDITTLTSKSLTLLRKQIRDYVPSILPAPFIVLVFAGLFCTPISRELAAKEAYLFAFVTCTLVGYAASAVELRYLFPLIPILLAWTAHGIVQFSAWFTSSAANIFGRSRRFSSLVVEVCILILLLACSLSLQIRVFQADDISNVPFEEKKAGIWIRDHSESRSPMVMSSNITVAYYAKANHIYLPDEDLSTVLEYAKKRGTDYLVFSERRMRDAPAFPPDQIVQLNDLRLVYLDEENKQHKVLVYQINQ